MSTTVNATFEVKGWDEQPVDEEQGGRKITRASVTKTFSGDIDGEATLEYVMAYAEDGTAAFVGIERIRGTIAGRSGSLVLQHVGRFAEGAAKATLTVVSGAGAGDLQAVGGSGDFLADPAGKVTLELSGL